MINQLSKSESRFYLLAWSAAVFYSIYEVSLTTKYFYNYHDLYSDFAPGWSLIGRKKDISDQEWTSCIPFLVRLVPSSVLHHIISQVIKQSSNKVLLYIWYVCSSTFFLCYYVGIFGTVFIVTQPVFLFLITYIQSKVCTWAIHILFLFVIHFLKTPDGFFQRLLGCNDEEHYMTILTMCWIFLRSISYDIDIIDRGTKNNFKNTQSFFENLLQKLGYCLYMPTASLGPLILYKDFKDSVELSFPSWNAKKIKHFVFNLLRYIFWIFFTEFSLHFVYCNAMQYHSEVVNILNPWALYGLGYCMGQFFLNKYVVIYGINGSLCALDDIKAPPQPKCIARIHLYSDMWKYFDRGLYIFLIRYVYAPIRKSGFSKLIASFLCFSFIFLWHGMEINIMIWAFLNFFGVTIEGVTKAIGKSNIYCEIKNMYLTPRSVRRLSCVLASPLLAMSAISNFYFFAGHEIGNIYMQRILHESWINLLILHFFLYCCCQVSLDLKSWELKNVSKLEFTYSNQ